MDPEYIVYFSMSVYPSQVQVNYNFKYMSIFPDSRSFIINMVNKKHTRLNIVIRKSTKLTCHESVLISKIQIR